jgi:Uma2 family endonuclease
MTLGRWANLAEDKPGELVDGLVAGEEVATNLHETAVSGVFGALRAWAKLRGYRVFGSEHKLGISASRGQKPDVCMYPAGTHLRASAEVSRTPPVVVVEVVSPSPRDVHRDRVEKLKECQQFWDAFYWLLDPRTRLVELLELGAGGR